MTSLSEEAGGSLTAQQKSHSQSPRIGDNFALTEARRAVEADVTTGRRKWVECSGRRALKTVGKSECGAQPLWRSSPGASMSVYQTALWDRDVTAPARRHAPAAAPQHLFCIHEVCFFFSNFVTFKNENVFLMCRGKSVLRH